MTSRPFSIASVPVLASCLAVAASSCTSGSSLSLNATSRLATDDGGTVDGGVQADAGSGGIGLCGQMLIERVRLVVRRIDLERAAIPADAGSAGAGVALCDCPDGGTVCVKGDDVHVGPFLVDLAGGDLDGGIQQVFDVEVPSGTYDHVRFVINTLSRRQAAGDGGLAEMKDLHASIVADGIFGGAPFQFVTPIHLQQKQQGPFTVGPGTNSIILTIDPGRWFVGSDGHLLDPGNACNRGAILANIRCSVRMSSQVSDAGTHFRKEFDDDEDEDRCRVDDADEGEHHDLTRADVEHDRGGDDHGHHACFPAPVLNCADAGTPAADGG